MALGGVVANSLTPEDILKKVSEYDILRAYWPSNIPLKLNTNTISPLRSEDDPSFIVGTKYGRITYKDMGDSRYQGDVWNFVKQIEHLADFNSVLLSVDKRFGLGISNGTPIKGKPPLVTWEQPKIELRPPPVINVIPRKMNKRELDWWGKYYQGKEDLKREDVYVPRDIYRNHRKLARPQNDLIFAYWYEEIQKWKIYRPEAPKKQKDSYAHQWKFDSSVPFDYVDCLHRLKGRGFMATSKKDRLCTQAILESLNVCDIQAEDLGCINETTREYINKNVPEIFLITDIDNKGIQFRIDVKDELGWESVSFPEFPNLEKGGLITDVAELLRDYKLEKAREIFKNQGL